MITRREFTKLSISVAALIASGKRVMAASNKEGNAESDSPRRVGRRTLGTYWGTGPERIDLLSGNLNFSAGLLTASSRLLKAALRGSYNSQMFTDTAAGVKEHGFDSGYGFGWRLQFAAINPIQKQDGSIRGYKFIDGYGSEYFLTALNGGWVSLNGEYMTWNPTDSTLRYRDGTVMTFGCISGKQEPDAGTLYPTSIQCSNGNIITVNYLPGYREASSNSSSRIALISDAESIFAPPGTPTFSFSYSSEAHPKLLTIQCNTVKGKSYSFVYSRQTVTAPFSSESAQPESVSVLSSVTSAAGLGQNFEYNQFGELTSATLERGAVLAWDYETFAFANGIKVREVRSRTLYPSGSQSAPQVHSFDRDPSDSARHTHSYAQISDGSGNKKQLFFASDPSDPNSGLLMNSQLSEGLMPLHKVQYQWSRSFLGTPYIGVQVSTLNPGSSDSTVHRTEIDKDEYGNTTEFRRYDSSNSTDLPRVVKHSYLRSSSYIAQHILNRRLKTTISQGAKTRTTHEAIYDSLSVADPGGSLTHRDASAYGAGNTLRGNPTESVRNGVYRKHTYDVTGSLIHSEDSTGTSATITYDPASNNTRIASITPNETSALASSFQHDASTGLLLAVSGSNQATSSFEHDSLGRIRSTTDPRGVKTELTRDDTSNASSITKSSNTGSWVKYVHDGLGRTIRMEQGDFTGLTALQEFEHGPVAVHPQGKLVRSAVKHAPTEKPVWSTRTYDALGRLTSRQSPGGNGSQTISYRGSSQTVTDGSGRWKRIHHDASGKIVKVVMPDTASGSEKVTRYVYDFAGGLTQVAMPRSNGTQTRHFQFDENGRMSLRQHVESGTQTLIHNSDGTLASKTDAKRQKEVLARDGLKRVTSKTCYDAKGAVIEGMTIRYFYDANPFNASFSQNTAGRLAAAQYGALDILPGLLTEHYSYTPAGSIAGKKVVLQRGNRTAELISGCSYDDVGRLSKLVYPKGGPTLSYAYDEAGRLSGVTAAETELVRNVAYTATGALANLDILASSSGQYLTEQHRYDAQNRLSRLIAGPAAPADDSKNIPNVDLAWNYSAKDGRVSNEDDNLAGTRTGYQYDENGRLESASSSDGSWGLGYRYDGFGNRTQQTVTQGQAYAHEARYDPATNWILEDQAAHDPNGNLISLPYLTMAYDARNRLQIVQSSLAGVEQYAYDIRGHRVWKATNGKEEFFFYLNNKQLAVYTLVQNGDGTLEFKLQSTRTHFGRRVVRSQGSAMVMDRLGAARAWSARNGAQTAKYLPFGETLQKTDDSKSSFGGYERDASGLDYAWHRYYSSRLGRFATPDPYEKSARKLSPDSWNRYAFVNNDPINRVDPNGLYDNVGSSSGMPTASIVIDVNGNSDGSYTEAAFNSDGTLGGIMSFDSSGNLTSSYDPSSFDIGGTISSLLDNLLSSSCSIYDGYGSVSAAPEAPAPPSNYQVYQSCVMATWFDGGTSPDSIDVNFYGAPGTNAEAGNGLAGAFGELGSIANCYYSHSH